jgi:hypothetical protein
MHKPGCLCAHLTGLLPPQGSGRAPVPGTCPVGRQRRRVPASMAVQVQALPAWQRQRTWPKVCCNCVQATATTRRSATYAWRTGSGGWGPGCRARAVAERGGCLERASIQPAAGRTTCCKLRVGLRAAHARVSTRVTGVPSCLHRIAVQSAQPAFQLLHACFQDNSRIHSRTCPGRAKTFLRSLP